MADVTPIQTSFNAGELSPRLNGRVDQNIRSIGVKEMVGAIPLLQGPAEWAPGTIFVAMAKEECIILPFEFNITQGYIIEAGDGYFRFLTNDVQIESAPDTPYEIVSPYTLAQAQELSWEQSADVLYLYHPDMPVHRLYRLTADTFAIEEYVLRNGPWEPRNSDESLTVTPSATTGSGITVTASSALFTADDVGGLMEIEGGDFSTIPSWEPGIEITVGALRQWNGNVYECQSGGATRTGTVAPLHTDGTEWDGSGTGNDVNGNGPFGVPWKYLYNRFGQVIFTGYTSATVMTATVQNRLASTAAAWRWRFGAFSDRRGYPRCGTIWQDRQALGKDATVHGSVVGALDDFAIRNELGDISRDQAFSKPLSNPNFIMWMMASRDLAVGSARGEHLVSAASAGTGAGPGNVDDDNPQRNGSAAIRPIKADDGRIVYVQKARNKLLQFASDPGRMYRQESTDLTRYADHIGNPGFAQIVWQQEPERLIWSRMDDGSLTVAAFVPDESLLGWAKRPMADGLTVKSIATITDPDGRYDQLWIVVQKGSSFMHLRMAPIRRSGDEALNKVMSDAAVVYDGVATDSISAPHLAGETVEIIADGKPHSSITLDGSGNGTLDYEAESIIFGLPYPSYMVTLPIEAGSNNGTAQMKLKRIHMLGVRVIAADGIEVSTGGVTRKIEQLQGDSLLDTAYPLFTGDMLVEMVGKPERAGEVTIRRYLPKPGTIAAIVATMQTGG